MKKLYFLVLVLCFMTTASAQIITIPDANFKNLLLNTICADTNGDRVLDSDVDTNDNGEVDQSEALAVVELNFKQFTDTRSTSIIIKDIKGIESFLNLKRLDFHGKDFNLNIQYQLSSFDLSMLINLEFLYQVGVYGDVNLSNLVHLKELTLEGNRYYDTTNNKYIFAKLNLFGCINLEKFRYTNSAFDIDFCQIPNLKYLDCSYLEGGEPDVFDFSCLTNLETLNIDENCVKVLILKNGSVLKTILKNQPSGLYCYPSYICIDDDPLELQQIKDSYLVGPNTVINGYCNFNPGGEFYKISGENRIDSNNNNSYDSSDLLFPDINFSLSSNTTTGNFISNSTGNYSIPVQAGTHTITPVLENPAYFNVSPTTVNVTFPTQASPFIQNFCITPNGVHPDLEITLLPLEVARPGFDSKYKLSYKNKGNTIQSGTVNLAFDDTVLDLIVANPVVSTQTVNNLSWNFSNLKPFETREITFILNVNGPTEIPAVISGAVLDYTATINSSDVDETPNDNTFVFNHTVVGSLDPNDKICLEGDVITPDLIGEYVHYLIRFENTGNYAAQNIVVKDRIDLSKFDISTLVPTSASHSFVTKISESNKVEFIFENVNLPFDDANNDGFIAFKIKTLPTLTTGDTFENEADIYFDYNFPVLTNKASSTFETTLSTQNFEFSNYFTLYPNPAKSVLNISSKEEIVIHSISVYNTLGQLVLVVPNAEKVSKIDISHLTTGNYFIKINSDKGTSNARFIKE